MTDAPRRLVSASFAEGIRRGYPRFRLAEIDHPDEYLRLWSRTGTLRYNGFDWRGVWILGRVNDAPQSKALTIREVTLELRGIPPFATKNLSAKVRGRRAQVWLGILSPRSKRVFCEPEILVDMKMDRQQLVAQDDGSVTIRIFGQHGFWNMERASNRAYSHESQIIKFPNDTGLSMLPELASKEIKWRYQDQP